MEKVKLKESIEKIDDPYLRKIASREIGMLERSLKMWSERIDMVVKYGWCFISERRELYSLILKEAEEAQERIDSIDFWISRAKDEGFPIRLLEIFKTLINRADKEIHLSKFFVMSKETFALDRTKEILRYYRRELSTETHKASINVILRNEFREAYPHICRWLQNVLIFDSALAIVELSDQFGESAGVGPIIGRNVKEISEEHRYEYGVLGNVDKYMQTINTLNELVNQRDPTIIKVM